MEVPCFAACTLLDFSFEGLMSWIIMFWGFWCFLACRRTGNERKFITVYSYQLSFRILINLEAFGSCKHTWKPHCEAGLCIPRCFNQWGDGIQKTILVINPNFPVNYLLTTTPLHHWCSFPWPQTWRHFSSSFLTDFLITPYQSSPFPLRDALTHLQSRDWTLWGCH